MLGTGNLWKSARCKVSLHGDSLPATRESSRPNRFAQLLVPVAPVTLLAARATIAQRVAAAALLQCVTRVVHELPTPAACVHHLGHLARLSGPVRLERPRARPRTPHLHV